VKSRFVSIVKYLVVLLVSFLCHTASAQTYVFGKAEFATGTLSQAIAAADFNGDGKLDLAVVNYADNTVSILLGKADGTFSSHVDYPTGTGPISIVTGDFNGDGYVDLAIANENCTFDVHGQLQCGPGTASILLGNGDGTFQPPINAATGAEPVSVAAGDFNGDGKLDLAVANQSDGTISVLIGDGDGTFQPQVIYTAGGDQLFGPQESLVVADFTGSGKLDLALASNGGVSFLQGKGNGTFASQVVSPGVCGGSAVAGDFNRDGKLDLAVTCQGSTGILLGNGNGTFSLLASYGVGGASITAVDLNGDGILDLATSSSGNFAVFLGNGDGTFQAPVSYGADIYPTAILAGDFNGDGAIDLAVVDSNSSELLSNGDQAPGDVSIMLGLGNGTFVGTVSYPVGNAVFAASADFNGDGNPDLATANFSSTISVLLGNGNGTFQPESQFATGGPQPIWIAAGDFNSDGKQDVVTLNRICGSLPCGPGSVSILLGNGDGTFQSHIDSSTGSPIPQSLALGDFNGDGKLDLVVATIQQISILLGNGDGTFQPATSAYSNAAGFFGQVVTGDFNGDGKLDLAVALGSESGGIAVLLGKGDGTFQPPITQTFCCVGGFGGSMAVGDFNGDGRLDLAAAGTGGANSLDIPSVLVLLGNGDGTFGRAVAYPTGGVDSFLGQLAVGDLNSDGKLDIANSNTAVSVLFGNGDGTFQSSVQYGFPNSPLTLGDFNLDGIPDFAGVNFSDTAYVMLSGAFRAVFPASLNFGSQGVGTTSLAQTITVTNPSQAAFSVTSIVAAGEFAQSNNCTNLPPRTSCTVDVTFSPTSTGLIQGTLTLTDDARVSPQVIPLAGTGVNGPFLTFSPASLNFGGQMLGVPSANQSVMLINTGNATLNITSVGVTGTNATDFSETNNCGSSLAMGGSCTSSVVFKPTSLETRQADLVVNDNASGSPQMMNLEGVGVAAQAVPAPTSLNFSAQSVGVTSAPQTVSLSNPGNTALNISQVSASGDFSQTNDCGASLAGHLTCTITVTFTPTALGQRSGSVAITDSASNSPQTVPLTGTGEAQGLGLGIASRGSNSATISAGQTAQYSLAIGGAGMSGTATLSCSGAPSGATCTVPATQSVNAETAADFKVTVTTTAPLVASSERTLLWPWAVGIVCMVAASGTERRKRLVRRCSCLVLLCLPLVLISSCGGGGSNGSGQGATAPGTYTLTVTAAANGVKESISLTLKVQ
jgi:hypothetical protein